MPHTSTRSRSRAKIDVAKPWPAGLIAAHETQGFSVGFADSQSVTIQG